MKLKHLAAVASAVLLAGCAGTGAGGSLSWTCTVVGLGSDGARDFTATVTAHNSGSAPVTVGGYAVAIYDAKGAKIF